MPEQSEGYLSTTPERKLSPVARAVRNAAGQSRIYQKLSSADRQYYDEHMTAIMEGIAQEYAGRWNRTEKQWRSEWNKLVKPNEETGEPGPIIQMIETLETHGLNPTFAIQVVQSGYQNALQFISRGVTSFSEFKSKTRKSGVIVVPGRQFSTNKVAPPATQRTTLKNS